MIRITKINNPKNQSIMKFVPTKRIRLHNIISKGERKKLKINHSKQTVTFKNILSCQD